MKLRIYNKAKGERGVYVDGSLEFIGAGANRALEGFTTEEATAAEGNADFRVQKWNGTGWDEMAPENAPDARQWLAVATDSKGSDYRLIELKAGEWFVGTAVASEEPENANGLTWAKIGVVSDAADVDGEGDFDPVAFLNTAAKNLDFTDKSQEVLTLLLETEKANKDRSGVIATIEELLTSPADPDKEEPTE